MKRVALVMALLTATPAAGQILMPTAEGVVAAHKGVVELYDPTGRRAWSAPGLETPTSIVVGDDRVALLDAWTNQARVVLLANGKGETFATNETPVDALFLGGELYVLERDSRTLSRGGRSVALGADPAFAAAAGGLLYVYSRVEGLLQEIDAETLEVRRMLPLQPFASDMEIEGRTCYLVHPRTAKLTAVDLDKFSIQTTAAGGTPADIAVVRASSALSATVLAIADPGAQRVWQTEGSQSFGAAFGRGFLRGLIGLGLFRPGTSEFPTGVDRIVSADGVTAAYDSASGTVYRVDGRGSRVIAQDVRPQGFTVSGGRIAIWRDGTVRFAD